MSLAALQSDMRAWLAQADEAAADRIAPGGAAGLAVYQNNYRAQLMDCLEEAFPHTLAWLGDTTFRTAAIAQIDAQPPASWSLDHYPSGFPVTLAALYPDDPDVAELAALEQALTDAFIGGDAPPLTLAMLAEIDWDRATLRLVPSAALLGVTSNAAALWTALDAGETPPPAQRLDEPAKLLVWRQGFVSCFRALEPDEADLLAMLGEGRAFADLCATLVEARGEEAGLARAGALLARWAGEACLVVPTG